MYKVDIDINTYANWQTFTEYYSKVREYSFVDWLTDRHPEIVDIRVQRSDLTMKFKFETIEHYHWFLLKVV